ncbi:hypothetical protein BGZ47_005788 [Haplosporangium gracile]|nr:hypothetical protein BGZ47_005788 [Haplosporangium gracile]
MAPQSLQQKALSPPSLLLQGQNSPSRRRRVVGKVHLETVPQGPQQQQERSIVHSCAKGENCGHISDRLMSAASLFMVSLLIDREFFVDWEGYPLLSVFRAPFLNLQAPSATADVKIEGESHDEQQQEQRPLSLSMSNWEVEDLDLVFGIRSLSTYRLHNKDTVRAPTCTQAELIHHYHAVFKTPGVTTIGIHLPPGDVNRRFTLREYEHSMPCAQNLPREIRFRNKNPDERVLYVIFTGSIQLRNRIQKSTATSST